MDNFEKVEKLREKAGVSYEEAKTALEQCNYDLLDAMIYLEKQGKVQNREPVCNLVVAHAVSDFLNDVTAHYLHKSWCS